jgi:glycosyltransferase involved in cell wall biosynthesis
MHFARSQRAVLHCFIVWQLKVADLQGKCTRVHTLVRVDHRTVSDNQAEIRAFMTVRDEILRLPRTFDHYRRIGVARFLVVDNGSTDGSKEFLLAQPDCHVFVTHNSYAEAGYGVEWQHSLLDEYGMNHWCLVVDADEWFIYPGYESQALPALAVHLERSGAQGMFAFLLDMYGSGTVTESISEARASPFEASRYFDRDYAWRRRFYIPGLQRPPFPQYEVIGGPRLRLLFPFLYRHYHLLEAMWQVSYYIYLLTSRTPLPVTLRPPPTLSKIPFVRWLPGTRYQSPHATTAIKLSDVTGVLLHFKFLPDFYVRVANEVKRKEHWDGAREYARYWAKLKNNPQLSFDYAGSVTYEGSEQLVRLGLLREDQGWEQIRETAASDPRARRGEGLAPLQSVPEQ